MSEPLSRDELLVLLIEECGEVIQAATKCLRFGFDVDSGVGYGRNDIQLSKECGELKAVIDALPLCHHTICVAKFSKIARAEQAKELYGRGALAGEDRT